MNFDTALIIVLVIAVVLVAAVFGMSKVSMESFENAFKGCDGFFDTVERGQQEDSPKFDYEQKSPAEEGDRC